MKESNRLLSLDVLRGFDMLFIMGMAELIIAVCALFPDGQLAAVALNMGHVDWDGLHFIDIVFPLFLFVAGISFPFSLAKQKENGASRANICAKIIRRGVILVIFGLIYNGLFELDFSHFRYASVLGRIGIAWMIATLLYVFCSKKWCIVIAIGILIGYWLALWLLPSCDNPFSYENNLVGYVDRMFLPGKLHEGNFDPEGIISTIPAIVTAMLGIFTGEFVRNNIISQNRKVVYMLVCAAVMYCIGISWSMQFPINKKLWTSTFVLVCGAYSLALFAFFYYIIDVKGWKRWAFPFKVIGMNAITIYMAQIIIGFFAISRFFLGGIAHIAGESWGRIILWAGYVAACWLFLYFLYIKRVFLKV